ncbi:MAG: hypothetical protein ACRDCG_01325 [Mycoplasmoidaceae bacterium]
MEFKPVDKNLFFSDSDIDYSQITDFDSGSIINMGFNPYLNNVLFTDDLRNDFDYSSSNDSSGWQNFSSGDLFSDNYLDSSNLDFDDNYQRDIIENDFDYSSSNDLSGWQNFSSRDLFSDNYLDSSNLDFDDNYQRDIIENDFEDLARYQDIVEFATDIDYKLSRIRRELYLQNVKNYRYNSQFHNSNNVNSNSENYQQDFDVNNSQDYSNYQSEYDTPNNQEIKNQQNQYNNLDNSQSENLENEYENFNDNSYHDDIENSEQEINENNNLVNLPPPKNKTNFQDTTFFNFPWFNYNFNYNIASKLENDINNFINESNIKKIHIGIFNYKFESIAFGYESNGEYHAKNFGNLHKNNPDLYPKSIFYIRGFPRSTVYKFMASRQSHVLIISLKLSEYKKLFAKEKIQKMFDYSLLYSIRFFIILF